MSDARSPGRGAPTSALARHDLLRRVERLRLSEETLPRVLRLIEREVEGALDRALLQRYSLDEVRAAGGDEALVESLIQARRDAERAEAIRAAGLHALPPEQLEALLSAARGERS